VSDAPSTAFISIPDPPTVSFFLRAMMDIRNSTKDHYAHFHDELTWPQQVEWWGGLTDHAKAWLLCELTDGSRLEPAGFGLLMRKRGYWWSTVGVKPTHAGKGYGRMITRYIIRQHDGVVVGVANANNAPAVALHRADEWKEWPSLDETRRLFVTGPRLRARLARKADTHGHHDLLEMQPRGQSRGRG